MLLSIKYHFSKISVIEYDPRANIPQIVQKSTRFPYLSINFPIKIPKTELKRGGTIYKYTIIGPSSLNFSLNIN